MKTTHQIHLATTRHFKALSAKLHHAAGGATTALHSGKQVILSDGSTLTSGKSPNRFHFGIEKAPFQTLGTELLLNPEKARLAARLAAHFIGGNPRSNLERNSQLVRNELAGRGTDQTRLTLSKAIFHLERREEFPQTYAEELLAALSFIANNG